MLRNFAILMILTLGLAAPVLHAQGSTTVRIQDITKLKGEKTTILNGQGLVQGLAGTGDEKSKVAASLAYDFSQALNPRKNVTVEDFASKNHGMVAVSLSILGSRSATTGLTGNVTIFGNSTSLKGGTLARTVLRIKGANSAIYAVASGPIRTKGETPTSGVVSVSLIKDLNKENEVVETDARGRQRKVVRFVLENKDQTTQTAIVKAINNLAAKLGVTGAASDDEIADADPIAFEDGADGQGEAVKVFVPTNYEKNVSEFISLIHQQTVNANSVAYIYIDKVNKILAIKGSVRVTPGNISAGGINITVPPADPLPGKKQPGEEVIDPVVPVGGGNNQVSMMDFMDALNSLGLTIDAKIALIEGMKASKMIYGELVYGN